MFLPPTTRLQFCTVVPLPGVNPSRRVERVWEGESVKNLAGGMRSGFDLHQTQVAFADSPACFRIDEMHQAARKARGAHKDIAACPRFQVRSPTLHAETCVGTAVDEWRHPSRLAPCAGLSCERRHGGKARDGA
jgi:hypothetical protein